MNLGVDGAGEAHLGSLEFLDRQPLLMPWPNAASAATQVDTGQEMATAEPADLVIMNPPFTRDSLRYDQFSRDEERKIKAREKVVFANKPTYMAGQSGAFLVLAEYINKTETGTIAVVLPLVSATDKSGLEVRRYLASRYHIETIVTSHDPERIYFSENTSIGEMLMICRRWSADKGVKPATRIVNLARNPATPAGAISMAGAINSDTVPAQGYGTMQEWPESRIAAGDWGGVQYLSPYLCEKFIELRSGNLSPAVALGDIAEIGPEGRRIRDAFTRQAMPGALGQTALWHHNTEVTQSMAAKSDTHIVAKPSKANLAATYWQQRSTLLLPNRMRLNTARMLNVKLDTPAVGSSWSPCNLRCADTDRENLEKAICVYLNSTIGILALLGDRTNRVPSYPRFSIDDLRKLRVPDFASIGGDAVAQLAEAYDAHAHDIILPLPQMDADPVRRALDAAVAAALGLDGEMVATIRRQLAAEPSVTGRRYGSG